MLVLPAVQVLADEQAILLYPVNSLRNHVGDRQLVHLSTADRWEAFLRKKQFFSMQLSCAGLRSLSHACTSQHILLPPRTYTCGGARAVQHARSGSNGEAALPADTRTALRSMQKSPHHVIWGPVAVVITRLR